MNASTPQASLADLARWLRVEEGEGSDRIELASAWQRLPEGSSDRLVARIGAALAAIVVVLLLLQALLTRSGIALALAVLALGLALAALWHLRGWFWRTVVDLDDAAISLAVRGWGGPGPVALALADVERLSYRMEDGQLTALTLEHRGGRLPLPFSGRRELDKLYFNLLRHLLQKRRPEIGFIQENEA